MVSKIDMCDCNVIHEEVVDTVKQQMPDENRAKMLAEFYKAFSDTTKVKILWALDISEMCVCDLSALLGVSQSAISHQLRTLKSNRLVKYRREGKVVYYALDDDHIKHIFDEGLNHITE